MAEAFTSWNFSAHELSEDQLVHAAFLMIQHALAMPDLERWRIPAGELRTVYRSNRSIPAGARELITYL